MKIVMYTKTGCFWCNDVRNLLNEKKVAFEEREIRFNPKYYEELVQISGDELTPTLLIDGELLADSDRDEVAAYLKKKEVAGF